MQTENVKKSKSLRQKSGAKASTWHKKIAAKRGASWQRNIVAGRRDAQLNPSMIRLLRFEREMNQDKFAALLDVSVSTFGSIERGKQMVKKDDAEKIAKRLRVSRETIFKPQGRKKFIAILKKHKL